MIVPGQRMPIVIAVQPVDCEISPKPDPVSYLYN